MGAVPENMVSVDLTGNGQAPWHGIGTVVAEALTAEKALELSGLDWEVKLNPVYDGDMKPIDGFFATTRSDNGAVLGIVGKKYRVINNVTGFSMVDTILGDDSAKIHTAGDLFGGKTVFILAKLPEDVKVAGDTISTYFLLTNTHDGSGALKCITTPVRVVCQNTLNFAIGGAKRTFSVRHTTSYEEQLSTARTVLGITRSYYTSFVQLAENLAAQAFTKAAFEDLCKSLLPVPTDEGRGRTTAMAEHEKLMIAYNVDNLDNIRGTKLGALNAVADYADHARRLVGVPAVRRDNAYARTFTGTDLKDRALEILTGV
jgi:phage/plasmid-like protein (TIGR03299 family)